MKILSYSDVITNSSSEVFVIHAKPEFQDEINDEIPEFLTEICETLGYNIGDIMQFHISPKERIDKSYFYYQAKNDLIIHSNGDNSIPGFLMDLIDDLPWIPKFKDKFQGFYAEDLGEKVLPYYDWNAPREYRVKTRSKEIHSVQRVHLG